MLSSCVVSSSMSVTLNQLTSLDLIRGFVAVGRRMSITLAADDLCLTQSAVSRQVRTLEDVLGVKLFVRGHRSIVFTSEGEPSVFPRLGVLPLRIVLLASDQPWMAAFCRKVMELNFVQDQDINQPGSIAPILAELGLPVEEILSRSQSETVKAGLRAQTEMARVKGVFGAPTFFVGDEMFWGNDRLDDALLFASGRQI
jgi:hypothetical protein